MWSIVVNKLHKKLQKEITEVVSTATFTKINCTFSRGHISHNLLDEVWDEVPTEVRRQTNENEIIKDMIEEGGSF